MRTVQSVKEITKRGSELSGPFFYIVKRSIWKVRQEMEEEKLRAVYYARCSTEEENQKDALVRQAAEAEEDGNITACTRISSRTGLMSS